MTINDRLIGTSVAMRAQHAKCQGTQKHYACIKPLFITVEMYILLDAAQPLFHFLHMVLASNLHFLEVKKVKLSLHMS
jgi:hypothetical protein